MTGQARPGQARPGQDRTGQDRTGQDRTTHHSKRHFIYYSNKYHSKENVPSILMYIQLMGRMAAEP